MVEVKYIIPDALSDKIERIYPKSADRDRVTKALEAGKAVYVGQHKLKGVKVEKPKGKKQVAASAAPASTSGESDDKKE